MTFDLPGLPLTPMEVDRFVEEWFPEAYKRIVARGFAGVCGRGLSAAPFVDDRQLGPAAARMVYTRTHELMHGRFVTPGERNCAPCN